MREAGENRGLAVYTHTYTYTIIQSVFRGEIGENLLMRIQDSSFEMNVSSQGSHLKVPVEHMMKVEWDVTLGRVGGHCIYICI